MCIPKSNHKKLVDDCYPPPKALVTSAPEYRPNSNELGRLTYYAQNKPAKLTKVGNLLESKAQADARAAKGSGPAADKGKAGLMITLGITKNLLAECKSSLNYFLKPAQSIIAAALDAAQPTPARPRDLEISARAASTFYALASFLDPATTSVDDGFQRLLRSFATLAVERPTAADASLGEDAEQRNRTRLIGLGALAGAVASDAVYSSTSKQLISLLAPALVENAKANRVTLDWLRSESKKATEGEPTYAEFNIAKKPLAIRRTRSISAHVAGEKGPSSEDVISAAIGTLRGLLRHADAVQVQSVVQNVIAWLDNKSTLSIPAPTDGRQAVSHWDDAQWCCWLAESLCSWTSLQYRFVVLDTLVDHLAENGEGKATNKHLSLIEMSRTILTGQLSLIGLSTSDTLSNLSALAVRRVYKDTRDPLLPPLVECISGLGTHVYYADQINDIVEEIAGRIAALQMPETASDAASVKANNLGAVHRGEQQDLNSHIHRQRLASAGPEQRDESIRVLLFCLQGVLKATHQSSGEIHEAVDVKSGGADASNKQARGAQADKGKAAAGSAESKIGLAHAGTRNRVAPSSILPTASLLASPNHAVRLAYAQTLITLFRDEFDREQLERESAVFAAAPIGERVGDAIGAMHALGAAAHVMCLSKSLSPPAQVLGNLRESPLELLPQLDRINADPGRPGSLNSGGSGKASDESTAALPVDYVAVAQALEHAVTALPCSAALALTPMLNALDKDAGSRLTVHGGGVNTGLENQRRLSSRMVAARVLAKLGETFDASSVSSAAQSVLSQIPSLGIEPGPSPVGGLTLPPEVVPFSAVGTINELGESSSSSSPSISGSSVVNSLVSSSKLQSATQLDATVLKRWLDRDWNVGIAVDEAFAGANPYAHSSLSAGSQPASRRPSYTPINGLNGSSAVVNGNNASSASVNRSSRMSMQVPSTGVNDLREALGTSSTLSSRQINGASQDTSLNADRRASRRESRRGPAVGSVNGSNGNSAMAILDSLKVGVDEDASKLGPDSSSFAAPAKTGAVGASPISPPYAS
ncbi:cellular morphogenesis-related protein [Pseudozyma hubeiensis SY62]|uniref:Cellular morphogenesis-related protein n=1 Tax=Pseudozyma hubeiensis (strain SY62) TaxID=1305764 RepID=R9NWT2_PSEHS|nr:cellular morphogenesis-related protein [Pseudozyma hubeiensis SY62]GAC93009.1 cellular morphogenesis-related protein [Pseudozyma hubeiensis SY62]